jgi:hypothetical protein
MNFLCESLTRKEAGVSAGSELFSLLPRERRRKFYVKNQKSGLNEKNGFL